MSRDTEHTRRSRPPLWTIFTATIIAMLFLMVACGSDDGDEGTTPGSEQTTEGEELYQANCASCHGTDLRGTNKGPSLLSIVYEPGHHGDDAFRSAVANGAAQHHWNFGDMQPVPGLSNSDVDAIIAYVREVQEREGLE
jgi:mono/diheme cytochrome c family protein